MGTLIIENQYILEILKRSEYFQKISKSPKPEDRVATNKIIKNCQSVLKYLDEYNCELIVFDGLSRKTKFLCKKCSTLNNITLSYKFSKKSQPCCFCNLNNKKERNQNKKLQEWADKYKNSTEYNILSIDILEKYKKYNIKFECFKHGVQERKVPRPFFQGRDRHICLKCARDATNISTKKNEKKTLEKAYDFLKHNNLKLIEIQPYKGWTNTKIKYMCKCGNIEERVLKNLLNCKYFCKKCYDFSKKMNPETFLYRAKKIHNNKYEYKDVVLETGAATSQITAICKDHGEFVQNAWNHLCGNGCPKCANLIRDIRGFNGWVNFYKKFPNYNGILYIVEYMNYIKIGITKNSLKERFRGVKDIHPLKIFKGGMLDLSRREFIAHSLLKKFKIKNIESIFDGYTECYEIKYKREIKEFMNKLMSKTEKEIENMIGNSYTGRYKE